MSLQGSQMELQQRMYELTEKYETLLQSTVLMQLEKEEYLKEVERLKYSNAEFVEKLHFLQTITKDSKQQARLLTKQLSTNSFELDAESVENKELKNRFKQNVKTINNISKKNELLKETNKRLQVELENMSMKYDNIHNQLTDSNREIEAYKTKIMQLENGRDILQQQLQLDNISKFNTQLDYSAGSLSDSEEKSLEYPVTNPHLRRDKTIDLKLTSMFSSAQTTITQRSNSFSRSSVLSLLQRQGSTKRLQNVPKTLQESDVEKDNITIYDDYYYDDEFDLDTDAQLFASASNASIDRRSIISYMSNNPQFVFNSGSPKDYDHDGTGIDIDEDEFEKLKIVMIDQQHKILEFEEMIHREKIGYDIKINVLNEKNENLKEQLTEKDKIIKKCTRQNYELNEQFNMQKKKLTEEWNHEKEKIVGLYQEKIEEIIKKNHEKIRTLNVEMDKYHDECKGCQIKLNKKIKEIKRLQRKNKELQMIVTAPPASSSCYSVADWFKFS